VDIANSWIRRKRDATFAVEAVPETKPGNGTPPLSPQLRRLSPLSTLVSKFIADNARKTHDCIEDEKERIDFVFDLREILDSVRDGKERPPRKSVYCASSHVIDFLAEMTESTLDSIQDEEERIGFKEHLSRALRQSFEQETMMIGEQKSRPCECYRTFNFSNVHR
jgi:hypothetical protein